ncbi:MAG: phosphoribosylglycinamide formyltransferase [Planctomycetes bacterium]|nr:phosphoribosylglycinamide formyltransferase [Planctomycetota bacterium]
MTNRERPLSSPLERPIRLVVLISGGGTTLTNLAARISVGELDAQIPLVIASRADCGGIQRAADAGLKYEVITRKSCASVQEFSDRIFSLCAEVQADLVVCAGFLAMIQIPKPFAGRVINIHPSLIPAFCGKGFHGHHVHEAVLARGARVSGCTVHFVDDEYDHGPIILQSVVPVEDNDTADSLAARVFAAECEALPKAIQLFQSGCLEIRGSRVHRLAR